MLGERAALVKTVALAVGLVCGLAGAQEKPLPAVKELQARALGNYDKTSQQREKYLCRERIENKELDGKGRVKQDDTFERELFYVNKHGIVQVISKNGKPLTDDEKRKQDERIKKEIEAASANKVKSGGGFSFSARDVLRYGRLVNERRILVAGRPTIVFDIAQDPDKGGSIEEKIIHAMEGTISVDEATGTLQDVNAQGMRDVKVGGGLVANVHKGFRIHMVLAPQPDGVWMFRLIEGKGDARIGLFMSKGADFKQETLGCKVYDVTAEGAVKVPVVPTTPK